MNDLQAEIVDLCEQAPTALRRSLRRKVLRSGVLRRRSPARGDAKPVQREHITREEQRAAIAEHRVTLRRELTECDRDGAELAMGWMWLLAALNPDKFADLDHLENVAAKRVTRVFPSDDQPKRSASDQKREDAAAAFMRRLKGVREKRAWWSLDAKAEAESRTIHDVARKLDLDDPVERILVLVFGLDPVSLPVVDDLPEPSPVRPVRVRPAGYTDRASRLRRALGQHVKLGPCQCACDDRRAVLVLRRLGVNPGVVTQRNWSPSDRRASASVVAAVESAPVKVHCGRCMFADDLRAASCKLQSRKLDCGFAF